MPTTTERRWLSFVRFVMAWLFVLVGILVAAPGIAEVVDAVLPYFERRTLQGFFNKYTLSSVAVGVFYFGAPSITIWAIAYGIRTGKLPNPIIFCVMGVIAAMMLYPTTVWFVALWYIALASIVWLLGWQPRLGPSTPEDVLKGLVQATPGFREYWASDSNTFQTEGGMSSCGVFGAFSHYYREHCADMSDDSLRELGRFISSCVDTNLATRNVSDAAMTCFLENLVGEPALARLRPQLSQTAVKFLANREGE